MIKGIDHITLTVKNLEVSRKFYENLLGKPVSGDPEHSCYDVNGGLFCIALPPKEGFLNDKFDENRIGLDHFAFAVETIEDLKSFEEKLRKLKVVTDGIEIDEYGNKHYICFKDPDNIQIEFYLR